MGAAQIPHCENVMLLMLPGIWIAALAVPHGIHTYNPYLYVILAVLINTSLYGVITFLILRGRSYASITKTSVSIGFLAMSALTGCHSASAPTPAPSSTTQTTTYPARPTTPPPSFKLFHQTTDGSFTLVTSPTATDTQIEALIYQLRDAAHTHTFDHLGIPQKVVDVRDPMVWFHIYRGPKCAPEKYTDGKLPCGASYNASGDYTFGGGPNHQWDDGVILHGEDHQIELWNPNAPYKP